MEKQHLAHRVFKEPIYATDGISAIRTIPVKNKKGIPFMAFIQTSKGEREIKFSTRVVNDILRAPVKELTEEEYHNWKVQL